MRSICLSMLLGLLSVTSCGQETEYFTQPVFVADKPHHEPVSKIIELEYKIRDINYPDTSYRRVYNDDYSLRITGLPLKITSARNSRSVFSYNGGYRDHVPFVIDLAVEKYQDCAAVAMFIHAIASDDYITVHDADGEAYSISPNGSNNKEYSMCNSYSIDKYDLERGLDPNSIMPGDLFAHGGYPGHVAIVLEVIENRDGHKQILIGQGWLPAVQFHLVWDTNPTDVWFSVQEFKEYGYIEINTQHTWYSFKVSELKRWKNR